MFPVDYRERMYAGGKVPGGFFKREGRPRDRETLSCRLIDRTLALEQVKDNMSALGVTLSPAEMKAVDDLNSPGELCRDRSAGPVPR